MEDSILQYVTLTLDMCQALEWKSMDSIAGIFYYLKKCYGIIYNNFVFQQELILNSAQPNCCSAKLSTSCLMSYGPVTVQSLSSIDYEI